MNPLITEYHSESGKNLVVLFEVGKKGIERKRRSYLFSEGWGYHVISMMTTLNINKNEIYQY